MDQGMGMAKRYLEMSETRGWRDSDATVCADCLTDGALVAAVVEYGGTQMCTFCEGLPTVGSAPLDLVVGLVVDGFRSEYEDPIEQAAYDSEDGYLVPMHDTEDLLIEFDISDRSDVISAVDAAISQDVWCQRDPYALTPSQALVWGWDAFRKYVKSVRRYTFLVHDPSTADGAGALAMHSVPEAIATAVVDAGLVKTLPAGTRWWRARVDANGQRFSSAAQIGTPPVAYAQDNRMSPKGIGAFYGASTREGAVKEVAGYADADAMLSLGEFELNRPVRVVDLREAPELPSLFDVDRRYLRAPVTFLQSFIENVRAPSPPDDKQNLEYVPTQVITEHLRYEIHDPAGPIEGIIWRSSKDPDVDVCVLFFENATFADSGSASMDTRMVLDGASVVHREVGRQE